MHCTRIGQGNYSTPPPPSPPPIVYLPRPSAQTRGENRTAHTYALLLGNPIPMSSCLESLLSRMVFERDRMSTSRCGKSVGVGGTGLGLLGVKSIDIFFFFGLPPYR